MMGVEPIPRFSRERILSPGPVFRRHLLPDNVGFRQGLALSDDLSSFPFPPARENRLD
jgi:hypothetical protein